MWIFVLAVLSLIEKNGLSLSLALLKLYITNSNCIVLEDIFLPDSGFWSCFSPR